MNKFLDKIEDVDEQIPVCALVTTTVLNTIVVESLTKYQTLVVTWLLLFLI